jgi:hypothetical protein
MRPLSHTSTTQQPHQPRQQGVQRVLRQQGVQRVLRQQGVQRVLRRKGMAVQLRRHYPIQSNRCLILCHILDRTYRQLPMTANLCQ